MPMLEIYKGKIKCKGCGRKMIIPLPEIYMEYNITCKTCGYKAKYPVGIHKVNKGDNHD